MSALWTIEAMTAAMEARPVGNMPDCINGISIDSRSLKKGEAYFAIKGDVFDGHSFVGAAEANGAALAVVSQDKLPSLGKTSMPLLVVDNVLTALEKLGIAARARFKGKVVAITGSVGKTTSKEILRQVLAASGSVHASVASFNNHWGVPLTLARMGEDVQFAVFEIGMNHPGEISPLVKMVRPDVVMITNVGAAHLGAFSGIEDIARAKAEIFDGLEPGGAAVLNRDDAHCELLAGLANDAGIEQIVTFGQSDGQPDGNGAQLSKVRLHENCSCLMAEIFGQPVAAKISLPGRHIVQNVLAVLAVVKLVDGDMAKSVLALAQLQAEAGRGRRHKLAIAGGTFELIDESYNANPASMRAALNVLATSQPQDRGRRIAVLGDMLELGATSAKLHAALTEPIVETGIDQVFLVGPQMNQLRKKLPAAVLAAYSASIDELKLLLIAKLGRGDVVMLKASKGMGFAGLVSDLVENFNRAK